MHLCLLLRKGYARLLLFYCFASPEAMKQALLFFATLAEGGKYKRWATLHLRLDCFAGLLLLRSNSGGKKLLFLSPKAFFCVAKNA
jgi:hypothetical protein